MRVLLPSRRLANLSLRPFAGLRIAIAFGFGFGFVALGSEREGGDVARPNVLMLLFGRRPQACLGGGSDHRARASKPDLDAFTALQVTEIAKANQFLAGLGDQPNQLVTADGMVGRGWPHTEAKPCSGIAGINGKFDLNMPSTSPQFQKEARHHNV